MTGRRALAWLLVVLAAAGCTPRAADHEQVSPNERVVARFSHVTAVNSPKHQAALQFAEAARSSANGRVEIQVYPNSQLYRDWEELVALQEGAIQFIAVAPSKLTAFDPAWQVYDLPYLFADFADVDRLFASPLGRQMRQRLEEQGLLALAIWPNGFKQFTNNRQPLVTPADFAGMTFRAQAGQVLQDQFQAVGARAVVRSFSSLFADIEQGQIQGQENTPNNIHTRNLALVQPYMTLSDHGFLAYVVITRAAWWHALDPGVRTAVAEGLMDATAWVRSNAPAMNHEALAKLRASGRVQIYTLTPQEREVLRNAFAPVYREMEGRLGGPFLARVLETVQNGR